MGSIKETKPQVVLVLVLSSLLTHAFGQALPTAAANTNPSESAAQSQPLWSYQVKPSNYVSAPSGQPSHYSAMPSLFDAFNGLSQRQGALTSSPFLSILPIILIAAGGMLLLLPFLTMMMASPFSGGGFGGYNQGFGYPQASVLSKKRSLNDKLPGQGNGLLDIIEHVSSTIDELTKKYSNGQPNKRSKSINGNANTNANAETQPHPPANHKSVIASEETTNSVNNLPGSAGVSGS